MQTVFWHWGLKKWKGGLFRQRLVLCSQVTCSTGGKNGSIAESEREGTRAETRIGLSAKRTSPFKSAGGVSSVDYWQSRSADQRAAIVLSLASTFR